MKVLHTSFECYPLAKVGGLADVVGALPKYLTALDCHTEVIMPMYDNAAMQSQSYHTVYNGTIRLGNDPYDYEIKEITSAGLGFTIYAVAIPALLYRPKPYGYHDDTERFLSFQLAVLDWLCTLEELPSIIHCHDHHTGLIPFLVAHAHAYEKLRTIPTVLTIHNAQYEGYFSHDKMYLIPSFDFEKAGLLDWGQSINPLAAAIKCAWKVTTVSPSYMEELQQFANGLEGLLSHENEKCMGILNGIDPDVWDPATDPMVITNYDSTTLLEGRAKNKEWICQEFGLDIDKPLFAFIGRMVYEKGADLLPDIVSQTLADKDVSLLILGSGKHDIEERLEALKPHYTGRYNTYIGYDEKLSHIIYAGADFLLMPSRVEPCGLNQMYALRYGLIPIVRRIGGLKDTIPDIGDGGYGICHDQASVQDVCYSIGRAVELYEDKEQYQALQERIITIDNSWNYSAKQYRELYKSLNQLK